MSKLCPNCKSENHDDSKFCMSCGSIFSDVQQSISIQQQAQVTTTEDIKAGNRLGIISLALYFAVSTLGTALAFLIGNDNIRLAITSLFSLSPLAGIVTMIVGRVKYPQNKLLKITMWVIIGSIIISIVLVVIFVALCFMTCASTDWSRCN